MYNKKALLLSALLTASATMAANPAYYISFDEVVQADFGGTGSAAVSTDDGSKEAVGMKGVLSKRSGKVTADKLLVPGIKGNAFASGKDGSGNIHTLFYKPVPAMRGNAGTISFWLKPENWLGNDKNQHVFITAANGQQRLLIYRIPYESRLAVFLGSLDKPGQATVIFTRVPSWKPGEWHQVTVSWNEKVLQLHLDGVSKAAAVLKTPITKDFTTLGVGEHFGNTDPGKTLIDEVRIFDSKLSANDLENEYKRLSSRLESAAEPIKFFVGKKKAVVDGNIHPDEYTFSTVGARELRTHTLTADPIRFFMSYDDENLYVASTTPGKALVSKAQGVDGKVWLDDSIEILLNDDKAKPMIYQLIFNANGAVYDCKNESEKWNASGYKSVSQIKNNVWYFEASIPWKSLGLETVPEGKTLYMNLCRNTQAARISLAGVMSRYSEPEHFIPVTFSSEAPEFHLTSLGKPGDGKLDLRFEAVGNGSLKVHAEAPAPLYAFDRESTVKLTPSRRVKGVITGERMPEKPLLHITAHLNNQIIYRNTIPCGTEQPVVKSHLFTDIDKKELVLVFKNQRLDAGKCQVNVIFFDRKKTKKIYEKTLKIDDSMPVTNTRLSIAQLPPGEYHIEQRVLDPAGKYLFTVEEIYMIPEKMGSWAGTKVGLSDEIPPPWTPVKDDKGTFTCWGRSYKFGGSGLLSSIKSQNLELVKAPVTLKFDGKAMSFDVVKTVAKPDAVTYTLRSGDKTVEVTAVAEYDGVIWFTVKLPAGAKKPSSLSLEIPLDRRYVDAFDDNNNCFEKISLIGKKEFKLEIDPVANPFFWCGGNQVGISGGTHTHRGRYVKDKRRAMSITGNNDEVLISVKLVDTPIKDTKERVISFYLQPTPTKPLNPKPWNIRDRINNMVVFNAPRYFNTTRPGHLDDLKKWDYHYKMIIKPHTAKDVTFQYYFAPKGAGSYTAEWNYFGNLWHNDTPKLGSYAGATSDFKKKPDGWTYGCLNCRNYLDFQLDSVKHYLANPYFDVRDLYFDLSWPRSCGNKLHGCVWVDEFGYEYHDNDLLALREFYRRVWHMVRQKNPDTFIIGHLISTRTPADSYFDVIAVGELYQSRMLKDGGINYYDVLDPELMRIAYGTRINEATVAIIGQFGRSMQLFMPDKWRSFSFNVPEVDHAARHFLTYELVCGLSAYYYCGVRRPGEIYAAFDRLGKERPVFHPWWDKNPAVKADNKALAALYTNKDKALCAVLNDTDKTVTVTLNFRADMKLAGYRADGVFTQKAYLLDGNQLKLTLAPREGELLFMEKNTGKSTIQQKAVTSTAVPDKNGPAYYISFDQNIHADFGGATPAASGMRGVLNSRPGKTAADKLIVPGIKSNAFTAGKDASGNINTVLYSPIPAVSGKECTISFWLKPVNWMGNDKNQRVFISASGPGSQRLLIYRIPYQSRMTVYLGPIDNAKAATVIFTPVPSWKPGQWQHVAVSWDENNVQLHLNGKRMAASKLKTPLPGDFSTVAVGEHFGPTAPGQTLIDEVRIFNRKLSEGELLQEYKRSAPAAALPEK